MADRAHEATEFTEGAAVQAGAYAVVDGEAYHLVRYQGYERAPLRVSAPGDQPCPPGFSTSVSGWERRLVPEEITAMYEVRTTARHRGRSVIVKGVRSRKAYIEHVGPDVATAPELAHLRRSNWTKVIDMVDVQELTDVIEQKVDLPIPPAGSSWVPGPVRAGLYAVLDGVTYRASWIDASSLWLLVAEGDPVPAGFTQANSGVWRRRVGRSDLTALFTVETTARWKGHPVTVFGVLGGRAEIEYIGEDITGHPELQYEPYGIWRGHVAADSLTHVIELPRDVG